MAIQKRLHEMDLAKRVIMGECWARDGLQNEALIVPTAEKIEMITGMVDAGFTKIEATNFSHPKILPQFADAEEVLANIPRRAGVHYRGICTNIKGVERAIASKEAGFGVDEIAMVISASETHNKANVNMGLSDNMALLDQMTRLAIDSGHEVFGWALTSFGCPIAGDVPLADVAKIGHWWNDLGATYIGFGDTTGVANPMQVSRFYDYMLADGFTTEQVVVHFHDTRGWGLANSLEALTFGFTHFDSSLGAIGGQPKTGAQDYHMGFSGNTCTEDLVGVFEEMGIATGIDLPRMLELGKRAEEILDRPLRSNLLRAGLVPHTGIHWDKRFGILDEPIDAPL